MVLVRVEEKKIYSLSSCVSRVVLQTPNKHLLCRLTAHHSREKHSCSRLILCTYQGYEVVTARVKRDVVFFHLRQFIQSKMISIRPTVFKGSVNSEEDWKRKMSQRHYTSHVMWPSPCSCAKPYHPGRYQATLDSCFGLLRPHQHGVADTFGSIDRRHAAV